MIVNDGAVMIYLPWANIVRQASHPLAADSGVDLLEASAPAGLGGPGGPKNASKIPTKNAWLSVFLPLGPWKTWKSLQQIDIISYPLVN